MNAKQDNKQYVSERLHTKMLYFFLFVLIFGQALSQNRGPPMVEKNPIFLDSFIPASMQVIAHITELLKYELRPSTGTTTTTTSTLRPTKPHNPGVVAPQKPLGPSYYFSKEMPYQEYVNRLVKYPLGYNYFDRYPLEQEDKSLNIEDVPQEVDSWLGAHFNDFLKLVNKVEDINLLADREIQVQEFSRNYDDSDVRFLLLRQKKQPPTRAYVTLLSLYDMLNKESKKLGLNKYNGYSQAVLIQLAEISTGTSADQLKGVLSKVVERNDTKNAQIIKKINSLLKDLDDSSSYISTALRYVPPLPFAL